MKSGFAASPSKNAEATGKKRSRRGKLASMSEKQTQAYLMACDALRRIRRTSSLLAASANANADFSGRSEAPCRRA